MRRSLGFRTARVWTVGGLLIAAAVVAPVRGKEAKQDPSSRASQHYETRVRPILEQYCFGCHGYGTSEGDVSLDPEDANKKLYHDVTLWSRVLRNVRGDIMPPAGEPRPTDEEEAVLAAWVKRDVFGIDPVDPDPGRVTLRRLNRSEYGATVRDLMGVDYDAEFLFPPDDSGYGFDNVGDVLSLSPLLMEKYLQAASEVVALAVPATHLQAPVQVVDGGQFQSIRGDGTGRALELNRPDDVRFTVDVAEEGDYRLEATTREDGSFIFVPWRGRVTMLVDGREAHSTKHSWAEDKRFTNTHEYHWAPGPHTLSFVVTPLPDAKTNSTEYMDPGVNPNELHANLEVTSVRVVGPLDPAKRVAPPNYGRFFPRPAPPDDRGEWPAYARETLAKFTARAFRRPADRRTLDRLVAIAAASFEEESRTFEQGVQDAMIAALASPRFLFRHEEPADSDGAEKHPLIDEYALASRLSYFLWGTMPDDELFRLAGAGELRTQLPEQVARMLADRRSRNTMRTFVGQWLRSRDVETVQLDALAILRLDEEFEKLLEELRSRGFRPREDGKPDPVRDRFREIRDQSEQFDGTLREAMRRETERHFQYVVEKDRSLLELIDCDYAFVNEKLAGYYGLPKVRGDRLRRVDLPAGSVRGGVLTQGTMLLVTSNPTRTSPVKRGLYVLENLLGTPPPPPPPDIPPLEDAADKFGDREPPLRELLAAHRDSPICSSCHQRMDPLGLALENFSALGQWRERDGDAAIEPAGALVSGEEFSDVQELKKILVGPRRFDYYRCVTQKLLTYALGRGIEPQDQETIDSIVAELEASGGRFRVLLDGIINSPAFQRMRRPEERVAAAN